jgi:hypothetical protein
MSAVTDVAAGRLVVARDPERGERARTVNRATAMSGPEARQQVPSLRWAWIGLVGLLAWRHVRRGQDVYDDFHAIGQSELAIHPLRGKLAAVARVAAANTTTGIVPTSRWWNRGWRRARRLPCVAEWCAGPCR